MSPPARQRLLPTLLAGPILRRTERTRVSIWLATSTPVRPRVEIFRLGSAGPRRLTGVGGATAETLALGPRLFIHLAVAVPDEGAFPRDELLAYDVELQADGSAPVRLGGLGLLQGAGALTYTGLPLPTFFIRERVPALNVMHGSCRLLHGEGEDSLLSGDELLARTAPDVAQRPSALFLTGDQIYADDVAGALIGHLRELASELMGPEDDRSLPGFPPLSELGVDGRAEAARDKVGFTGPKLDNHLLSFGEFAAMYLTAWNGKTWPIRFPSADEALGGDRQGRWAAATAKRRYARQVANLERARAALPAVRRLLANVPTYMIFDDHDVADDWNLTAEWRDRVHASPTGRRFIANALAAYFAFQGWGNHPDAYDASLKQAVAGFLGGGAGVDGASFDSTLWAFDRWAFHAPTSPPTIVLDTRTQRSYDSPDGAARLIGADGRGRVEEIARACGHRPGAPLILVSAVPVYGLELQERRQKYLAGKVGPYEIDFEAWHSNLRGLVDFMQLLIDRLRPSWCLMLSGDIHYGCNALARFAIGPRALPIVQLVSSSQKHSGALSRRALDLLGRLVRRKHERAGWNGPPAMAAGAIRKRLLSRPVSTDEWNEDAPVFLAPRQARRLRVQAPPDYREARVYVPPSEERASKLVGENNLGVVSLVDAQVTHRLLARGRRGTRVHAATMPVGAEGQPDGRSATALDDDP